MLGGMKKDPISLVPLQLGLPLGRGVCGYLFQSLRQMGGGAWLIFCKSLEADHGLGNPGALLPGSDCYKAYEPGRACFHYSV